MTLTEIGISNLLRRKSRTVLLLFTFMLIIGITVSLKILSLNLEMDLNKTLIEYGENIVISPSSEQFTLSYGGLSVPRVNYDARKLKTEVLTKLNNLNDKPTGIAPKIIGSALGSQTKYLVVGVDFSSELKMKPWWKIEGKIPQKTDVVIGSRIAHRDKLSVGSSLELNNKLYIVSGIIAETGGSEDLAIFATIPVARELTGITDSWSLIELNTSSPETLAKQLRVLMPEAKVTTVQQLTQGSQETVERFKSFSLFSSILLIIIGTLVIMVTVNANIHNRVSEFGILCAIGYRQKHIIKILLFEIWSLGLLGGFLGYFFGILSPSLISVLMFNKVLPFHLYPLAAVAALVSALVIGTLCLIYPWWRVNGLNPVDALRYI